MAPTYDVVLVGARNTGPVSAVMLARAARKVVVVEANDRLGGAVASGEMTRPRYVHDLFATSLNLLFGSRFYAEFSDNQSRYGQQLRRSDLPYARGFPGGRSVGVSVGVESTLERLHQLGPRDAEGWQQLHELHERVSSTLFSVYTSPVPSDGLADLAQLVS